MSTQAQAYVSLEEYLEHERQSDSLSEYYGGEVFPMEAASPMHSVIVTNLAFAFGPGARKRDCNMYFNLRIAIEATGLHTYPDVTIVCGQFQYSDKKQNAVINPKIIFEVSSPSTRNYDGFGKFKQYAQLPSLEEYFVVAQDSPHIDRFLRQPDGGWLMRECIGLDQTLKLETIDLEASLATIYEGAPFAA